MTGLRGADRNHVNEEFWKIIYTWFVTTAEKSMFFSIKIVCPNPTRELECIDKTSNIL